MQIRTFWFTDTLFKATLTALIKSPKVKTVQDENGIEVCEEIPNEYVYSLRYTEFIPIAFRTLQYCIKEIKSLNKQIETLKDE